MKKDECRKRLLMLSESQISADSADYAESVEPNICGIILICVNSASADQPGLTAMLTITALARQRADGAASEIIGRQEGTPAATGTQPTRLRPSGKGRATQPPCRT